MSMNWDNIEIISEEEEFLKTSDNDIINFDACDRMIIFSGQPGETGQQGPPGLGGVWGQITGNIATQIDLQNALNTKQDVLTFDVTPTDGSSNPVTSDGIYDALALKANTDDLGTMSAESASDYYDKTATDALLADKADIIKCSDSGSLVHLTDGSPYPVDALTVGIEPVQDLHGYDHPWPAGGGPNLWNTSTALYHYSIGSNMDVVAASSNARMAVVPCEAGNSYTATKSGGSRMAVCFIKDELPSSGNIPAYNIVRDNASTTLTSTAPDGALYFCAYVDLTSSGNTRVDTSSVKLSVTSNICPITGHTEANVFVEDEYDADADPTVTIDLDGTRYGGSLNVLTGVLTVTDGYIASYNGETLPSTWISDRDVYVSGQTPTTGAEVVYKLASPLSVQLDSNTLSTLLGENYIWADTGDTSVTYRADTKLYIEKLTNPSEDDMIANTNIASGVYFMVGNSLLYSTASIASGEAIVPGTNCTALSLADALNNLNA